MENRERFVSDQKRRFFREVVGQAVLANTKNRKTEEAYIRELIESVRRMGSIAWVPELDAISIDDIAERVNNERLAREKWSREIYAKALRLPEKYKKACADKLGTDDLLRFIWENMHDCSMLNVAEEWVGFFTNRKNERMQICAFALLVGFVLLASVLANCFG